MLQWGILGLSVVPACLKMAVITPILKKPSLCVNALNNFRPISNLPFLSKVIEKVVNCCSAVLSPVSSRHPWPHAVSLQTWAQHGDGAAEDPGRHQQRSGRWGRQSACSLGSRGGLRHHRPHHPAGASGGCGWHSRGCTGLAEVLSP